MVILFYKPFVSSKKTRLKILENTMRQYWKSSKLDDKTQQSMIDNRLTEEDVELIRNKLRKEA